MRRLPVLRWRQWRRAPGRAAAGACSCSSRCSSSAARPCSASCCGRPRTCTAARVSYFAPEQDATSDPQVVKSTKGGKKARAVAWAGWGFDPGHRRHNPQAQQRPALLRGLGRRARLAGGVPARRRRQGRLHRDVQGQRRLVQSADRQAPLDAQGPCPARDQPGARRAPRLRLVARRRRARAAPQRRQARVALPRRRAHRVVAAARRRHALLRRRGRHADRAERPQRPPPLARARSAARSRARPPTAAACSSSAPTTATSTASTRAPARGAGAPGASARYGGLRHGPLLLHADDRLRPRLHRLDRRPHVLARRRDRQDRVEQADGRLRLRRARRRAPADPVRLLRPPVLRAQRPHGRGCAGASTPGRASRARRRSSTTSSTSRRSATARSGST